jgi:hypothetical protein
VVEVNLDALFVGKLREILVVIVLLKDEDVLFREGFDEPARDGRFPRTGSSANPDNQRLAAEWSNRAGLPSSPNSAKSP